MFGFLKDKFEREAQAAIERRARQLAPDKAPPPAKPATMTTAAKPATMTTAAKPATMTSAAKPAAPGGAAKGDDRQAAIARMQSQVQEFVTPERQALINQAMAVHRAKQKILAELDDESRAKLVAMAITTLLHSEPSADKTKK